MTVYGANQTMVQRALAARNIGDAKKAYLTMGFAGFFIYFLFFFIGALLFVHFKGQPFAVPNAIMLVYAKSLAIPGLLGILAAAVLSSAMSALSGALNSQATISLTDFYQRFFHKNASDKHYLTASRLFTVFWALAGIPIAIAFASSGGSILQRLTEVSAYLVSARFAMYGMGFFSKHTTERGLLVGVVAGFISLFVITANVPQLGLHPLPIAWPWLVVISSVVNIVVAWLASILLDGFQKEWHEQSVPGQIRRFREKGLPEKEHGWYLVPGKIDRVCWLLLVFFVLTIVFLVVFARIGGAL